MTARDGLPDILSVDEVRERYGLADARAARKIAWAAGGFRVGNRIVVRADDLDAWERARAEESKRAAAAPQAGQEPPRRRTRARTRAGHPKPLEPDWWRAGADAA